MSITITFQNDLAQRLESAAIQRQVSVEELATTILDRAVPQAHDAWGEQNQRRLTLIRKSIRQSLTAKEQQELDRLQAALDVRFEDFDAALKAQLDLMHSAVE
jgi:hypothetical protein